MRQRKIKSYTRAQVWKNRDSEFEEYVTTKDKYKKDLHPMHGVDKNWFRVVQGKAKLTIDESSSSVLDNLPSKKKFVEKPPKLCVRCHKNIYPYTGKYCIDCKFVVWNERNMLQAARRRKAKKERRIK